MHPYQRGAESVGLPGSLFANLHNHSSCGQGLTCNASKFAPGFAIASSRNAGGWTEGKASRCRRLQPC